VNELFAVVLALVAAISWGANSHILKRGMKDGQDPYLGLFIRSLSAFPILFVIVFFLLGSGGFLPYFNPEVIALTAISSALIVIGDSIFMYSLDKLSVSLILPITSIYPLITVIILLITGQEIVDLTTITGTLTIVLGVALVTSGRNGESFQVRPLILGLASAVSWGTSIYFVRLIFTYEGIEALGLTGIRFFYIGVMGLVVFLLSPKRRSSQKERSKEAVRDSIKFILLSGLIGWAFGATMFFLAIQIGGASIPTPVSSTNPIIATLIGLALGIDQVTKKQFSGIILSVVGTIIIVI